MGHDWVFDVLGDLKSYAIANGLSELAQKADEAMKVAVAEIAALGGGVMLAGPKGSTSH
jgi:hypothetical protein